MAIILQTPRLTVREFLPEELESYLDHFFNDEEVARHLPRRSREERIVIFNNSILEYADSKQLGKWGLFNRADGEFIGSCLLRFFNDEPGCVEIGYSMERKFWGQGLGTEMANAVIDYAFADNTTEEVVGVTTLENIASQRVLEKAGLVKQENIIKDGMELAYFIRKR